MRSEDKPANDMTSPFQDDGPSSQETTCCIVGAGPAGAPNFQVVMGARVEQLIEHDGTIAGVRYRGTDGMHEGQANLTIGADGRFSRVRGLAQLASIKLASPIDLLWFKLPGEPGDDQEEGAQLYFGAGRFLVAFYRYEYWQVGYGFLKGGYQELKASGVMVSVSR